VTEARAVEGRAKTDFEASHERFERTMERIYGRLLEKYGKKKAERFFPRRRRGGEPDPEDGSGGAGTPS